MQASAARAARKCIEVPARAAGKCTEVQAKVAGKCKEVQATAAEFVRAAQPGSARKCYKGVMLQKLQRSASMTNNDLAL